MDLIPRKVDMPIEYTVHYHGTLVYAKAHGALTDRDLVEHERALMADDRLVVGFRQLLDCRWGSDDQISDSVFRTLSEVHDQAGSKVTGSRYAIVAQSAWWFRAGSRYRGNQCRMTVIVFNDPSTACIWLGIDYMELVASRSGEPPPVRGSGSGLLDMALVSMT